MASSTWGSPSGDTLLRPQGEDVGVRLAHRVLAEGPGARTTGDPVVHLVAVVVRSGVPTHAALVDPRRRVEVREVDDHPHGRCRRDLVALARVPGVGVDDRGAT